MSSNNAHFLSAVALAALLQCALGAPVTDSPEGDTSGEEVEMSPDLLSSSRVWGTLLHGSETHKQQLKDEFQDPTINYEYLENFKTTSFPEISPKSNLSKEAILRQVAQDLLIYNVLLKHVEREYPGIQLLSEIRGNSRELISLIKNKMKNPDTVTALTSSEEEQLLKDLDNPDPFRRKMTAHSILSHFYNFVNDGKKAITRKERLRGGRANRSVSYFYQMLR